VIRNYPFFSPLVAAAGRGIRPNTAPRCVPQAAGFGQILRHVVFPRPRYPGPLRVAPRHPLATDPRNTAAPTPVLPLLLLLLLLLLPGCRGVEFEHTTATRAQRATRHTPYRIPGRPRAPRGLRAPAKLAAARSLSRIVGLPLLRIMAPPPERTYPREQGTTMPSRRHCQARRGLVQTQIRNVEQRGNGKWV
jgi:hypothetical protein